MGAGTKGKGVRELGMAMLAAAASAEASNSGNSGGGGGGGGGDGGTGTGMVLEQFTADGWAIHPGMTEIDLSFPVYEDEKLGPGTGGTGGTGMYGSS